MVSIPHYRQGQLAPKMRGRREVLRPESEPAMSHLERRLGAIALSLAATACAGVGSESTGRSNGQEIGRAHV